MLTNSHMIEHTRWSQRKIVLKMNHVRAITFMYLDNIHISPRRSAYYVIDQSQIYIVTAQAWSYDRIHKLILSINVSYALSVTLSIRKFSWLTFCAIQVEGFANLLLHCILDWVANYKSFHTSLGTSAHKKGKIQIITLRPVKYNAKDKKLVVCKKASHNI